MKSTIKSELAPKGLNFKVNEFMIGGQYATIFTVIEYPKSIYVGFLSGITNIPGVKVSIKHIPIDFSKNASMKHIMLKSSSWKQKNLRILFF